MIKNGKAAKPPKSVDCKPTLPVIFKHKPEPDRVEEQSSVQSVRVTGFAGPLKKQEKETILPGSEVNESFHELVIDLSEFRADQLAGDSTEVLNKIMAGEITDVNYHQMRLLVKDLFYRGMINELYQLMSHPNRDISIEAQLAYDAL